MKHKIMIVEDKYIEAYNISMALKSGGYEVLPAVKSVSEAVNMLSYTQPDIVLVDIYLSGELTGIDLAKILADKNIPFVYLSGNSEKNLIQAAKNTMPYGFLLKPFRKKEVLVMLEIALYVHREKQKFASKITKQNGITFTQEITGPTPGFIGENKNIQEVIGNANIVGPAETTVLINGESGTGKELLAKLIHQLSPRRDEPLVVVNCAALPASLIESELFGHEKGAFTGAIDKRIGKFEQADGGTIFLDEIGELTAELQMKFLRVIQEKEVEPIAGKRKKVNVRIIAATNKDLLKEVSQGRFRIDLYYRLNVFPITMPPLRERGNDISLLAEYFTRYFSAKQGKVIAGVDPVFMEQLKMYTWPGNVRELENIIERGVLISNGGWVSVPGFAEQFANPDNPDTVMKTIDQNERDHILKAIERCDGKIYGEGGAAKLLNINPSTLKSRMGRLGITKGFRSSQ